MQTFGKNYRATEWEETLKACRKCISLQSKNTHGSICCEKLDVAQGTKRI